MKSKERKFAEFVVERLRASEDNKAIWNIVADRFKKIFIEDPKNKFILAVHNNEEKVFRISHKIDDTSYMCTQAQEKSSTLKPYKLNIYKNNIQIATLEDLIRHNII